MRSTLVAERAAQAQESASESSASVTEQCGPCLGLDLLARLALGGQHENRTLGHGSTLPRAGKPLSEPYSGAMMGCMSDWLWVVFLVGMFAVAVLWGYWVTRRRIGFLYACYAATAAWIGAVLVRLALTDSAPLAAMFAVALAVALPFMFRRDKRRVLNR